jgi:hypothetical protein
MAQHPFPGDEHDGDEPSPGTPARDGADDWDGDAHMKWLLAEIDAGRIEVPPQDPPPGVTVSLGAAGDVGLEDLAAMAQGLSGEGFAQNEAADAMRPGPVLGALTARAVEDMASLPDDELLGVVSAARRQQARAEYEELAAIGEFTRRREQQYEASIARGDKPRQRDGEHADAELAMELGCSPLTAGRRMDFSGHLSRRLPHTFTGMAAGVISGYKAKLIYEFTRFLSDARAAEADKILAAAAPGLNPGELKDKAARLEMKLDPRQARDLIAAASRHRRTRWCVTVTGEDGEAIAHGCARGRHPWNPASPRDGTGNPRDGTTRAGPGEEQQAQLADLLRQLGITPAPIAQGECDHRHQEDRYRPSRKLQHLIRARTATCCAPGCNIRAVHCEIDHTTRYPDGTTCECNLGPPCSRHHHAKHAPEWKLEQPEPGVMRWTPPSGRSYITTPTRYDA